MQSEIRIQNDETYRFEQVQFSPFFTLLYFLAMLVYLFLINLCNKIYIAYNTQFALKLDSLGGSLLTLVTNFPVFFLFRFLFLLRFLAGYNLNIGTSNF